jgi:limonene-1,2-epoxide hydrolase
MKMGLAQEKFVEEFCAAWGDGSSETRPDVEKILSMMAEDAQWQLWVPGGPIIRGREALRAEIHRQMRFATNNKCNIVHVLSSDRMVMQERSDTAIILGKPCPHQMVAVYELDEKGLIKRWREYLDMADLTRKMEADEKFAARGG